MAIAQLLQIVNVEPTPIGFFGAALFHFLLWIWIHNWEFGLMSFFYRPLCKWKRYNTVIRDNFAGDPTIDILGFHKEPQMVYFWNLSTAFHHAWGGAIMLIAWYYEMPWLWRHGMLTEVAAYDFLDLLRMAYTIHFPEAVLLPMSAIVASGSPYMKLAMFHHTVGLTVGSAVIIYFSEVPEFQVFGVVIMGGPFFVLLPGMICNAFPLDAWLVHTLDKFIQMACWIHQRIWFFFTATYHLMTIVIAAEAVPQFVKAGFCWGAFALAVFNVGLLGPVMQSFYMQLMSGNSRTARKVSMVPATTVGGALVHAHMHWPVFVVVQSHKWAERAKTAVKNKEQ